MNRFCCGLLRWFMPLAMAVFSSGCDVFSSDDSKSDSLISILNDNDRNLSFMGPADSLKVYIYSDDVWTAESDSPWCSVYPLSGESGSNQITVSVSVNASDESRDAVITLTSGSAVAYINVSQAGVKPSILKITHVGDVFKIPFFEGILSGVIDWGDGSTSDIGNEEDHHFSGNSKRVITIEMLADENALEFELNGIEGVTEVDFSDI